MAINKPPGSKDLCNDFESLKFTALVNTIAGKSLSSSIRRNAFNPIL